MRLRLTLAFLLALSGCHAPAPRPHPIAAVITPPAPVVSPPLVLHIPGISGESVVDHTLRDGVVEGFARDGRKVDFEIYDWTENDPGIPALQAYARNRAQSRKITALIVERFKADPTRTIRITCHSGGAGLVGWALEGLPAEVNVKSVLFIAPALSPGYDLSKALSHVKGFADVFWSSGDTVVLNAGTTVFGTIDGVYGPSAGYTGFKRPPAADAAQYAKLRQHPYDLAWAKFDNGGDHIGPMEKAFAREVLAPVLEEKTP